MKKTILTVLLAAVPAADLFAAAAEDSKIFTPFFDMTLTEAGYLPSEGNIFSGGNINTQVGLLSKITQKDHLFALYNFNYAGPGFAPQDSRQFTDRSMSHGFNFEYRRFLTDDLRIRPGVSIATEYRRTGANEAWENGLYNMDSKGGQLALDYSLNAEKNGYVTAQVLYRSVKFPNYTDLLREFQNAGNTAETSGGLQDQTMTQFSLRPNWGRFFGGITYTMQDFKNQHVVGASGVYEDGKQEDRTTALDFGFHQKLWIFELYPMISYSVHTSNQNFMLYKFLGDTSPQFSEGYYDYTELAFSVPLDLNITSKWAIGGSLNVTKRSYDKRKARDAANNFTGSAQENTMSTLTGSIRKRINEVAMVRLFYSLVVASSNNKFEQYMPYNYTGNSFGVAYQLSY